MENVKFSFPGKIVLITGAATGIGKETAVQFAKAGATVLIADFNEADGKKAAEECAAAGAKSAFFQVDVSDEKGVHAMAEKVLGEYGYIDILISNAGVGPKKYGAPFTNVGIDDVRRQFEINSIGFVNVVQAFYKNFVTRKQGKIVCTASVAAYISNVLHPHYSAAKAAVLSYVKTLAVELGNYNVNVNALAPGFVYTPIYHDATDFKAVVPGRFDDCDTSEQVMQKMALKSAMHRQQSEADMAYAMMFLSSDAADNVTGQTLIVDSGYLIV